MARHQRPRPSTALKLAIMARFAESGLGVAAFCQRESISTSSFYRWRSLRGGSSPREVVPRSPPSVTRGAAAFVDLGALSVVMQNARYLPERRDGLAVPSFAYLMASEH